MKTLVLIIPVSLSDDGMMKIKNFRSLKCLIGVLRGSYEITLIVQTHRGKVIPELDNLDVEVLYDNMPQKAGAFSAPSRFQESYFKWVARGSLDMHQTSSIPSARYNCLIGWDGCSPWCLAVAAASAVATECCILLLHDDPHFCLMQADHVLYANVWTVISSK